MTNRHGNDNRLVKTLTDEKSEINQAVTTTEDSVMKPTRWHNMRGKPARWYNTSEPEK